MSNVISIRDRMEIWSVVYASPDGDFEVFSSNHGRVSFKTSSDDSSPIVLDFVDAVRMLLKLSNSMCFSLETKRI